MEKLYCMLLTIAGAEIIIDIISYILIGKHNLLAISLAIIYLFITIMVYVYNKFSNKDE